MLKHRFYRISRWPVAVYLSIIACMMFIENSLVYFPQKYPAGGEWNAGFEDAWFVADDGTKLHGWFAEHESPERHVLYLHGNGGNVAGLRYVAEVYRELLDANVLVFDYRGYGRSEGKPNESGVIQDSRAARRWLADRVGVAESEIVLIGRSLGGGAAISIASEIHPQALVLQNTFTSLPDVAQWHYPWLPVRWLMRNRYDSISKIGSIKCPVLQSHGTRDRVVPFDIGERLFQQIDSEKQFITLADGTHNQLEPAHYLDALISFLRQADRHVSHP
ncbi:MAG: alpha/beta hydrolase [Planctomycetales bacterium]|nr:alpha/beta hydrolase [Planctomycetales bacterium]